MNEDPRSWIRHTPADWSERQNTEPFEFKIVAKPRASSRSEKWGLKGMRRPAPSEAEKYVLLWPRGESGEKRVTPAPPMRYGRKCCEFSRSTVPPICKYSTVMSDGASDWPLIVVDC